VRTHAFLSSQSSFSIGFNSIYCAVTSFSLTKLHNIVNDIEKDADQIDKLARLIDAGQAKGERESAELERFKNERERTAAQKERQLNMEMRAQQMADQRGK
jgi:vacuolar-type H+-ATPase subunit I/STV1